MAAIFGLIGAVVSAAGSIAAGSAAKSAAQAQAQMSIFKAKQEEQAAGEARASGQRRAEEESRKGRLAQSQLQARAAADGGSATDPTVLALGEDIAGRSRLGAGIEYYKGENQARGFENQAELSRMQAAAQLAEGSAKQTASYFSAGGTLIGGVGSAFSAYKKEPVPATAAATYGYG